MDELAELIQNFAKDAAAFVTVVDERVVVELANAVIAEQFGSAPQTLVGKPLVELLPGNRGVERARVIAQVIADGETRCYLGMAGGVVQRSVFRRVSLKTGRPTCLVTSVPLIRHKPSLEDKGQAVQLFAEHDFGPLNTMTSRELEVYRQLGLSRSVPAIAKVLHRSARTVETHRESIGQKLGVVGRVALAQHSSESGVTLLSDAQFAALLACRRPAASSDAE